MPVFLNAPEPPYYAVIFASQHGGREIEFYDELMEEIVTLAVQQPGYLGLESARNEDGFGITIVYYDSLEAIDNWRRNPDHQRAKAAGRNTFYDAYKLRIAKVEDAYPDFVRDGDAE